MRYAICNLQRYYRAVFMLGVMVLSPCYAWATNNDEQSVVVTPTLTKSVFSMPSPLEKADAQASSKIPTLAPVPPTNKVDYFAEPFNPQSVAAAVTVKPALMKKGYSFEEPVSARRAGTSSRLGSKDIFITESSDTGFSQSATPVRSISQSGRSSR